MILARDAILTATILALIFIAAHWPQPVKSVEVPYCVVSYKAAGKDAAGEWHTGWAYGYGPCSLQDSYRQI